MAHERIIAELTNRLHVIERNEEGNRSTRQYLHSELERVDQRDAELKAQREGIESAITALKEAAA